MRRTLIKKQLAEVFSSLFYDAKRNRTRTKGQVVLQIVMFVVLVFGVLGGIFTAISIMLCHAMYAAGVGWFYYVIVGGIGLLLGIFGSVFTCYNSLYKAKDNSMLLAMPIPAKEILVSRLVNVYLMSLLYSAVIIFPAVVVYWIKAELSALSVIGGIDLALVISVLATVFSCLIGWIVAKLSAIIKNKKAVTLVLTVAGIGIYFFFVRNIYDRIQFLVSNAVMLGDKVKGAAYFIYLFGRAGEGDVIGILVYTLIALGLAAITVYILSRSFFKLVTIPAAVKKTKYTERSSKLHSQFGAAFIKEFRKFMSNTNYILNCGMGVLFMTALGVYVIIRGEDLVGRFIPVMGEQSSMLVVFGSLIVCMLVSMNYMVAPSISLEGKNLWIYKSMPIEGKTVIFAKIWVQLVLTLIPELFVSICIAAVLPFGIAEKVFCVLLPTIFTFLCAYSDMFIALRKPNFSWTNEIIPIKQSGSVALALFGAWAYAIVIGLLYFAVGSKFGTVAYMGAACTVTFILAAIMCVWLKNNADRVFTNLG